MKPEFRIREVTRYVITQFDEKGSKPIVECDSLAAANTLVSALRLQATGLRDGCWDDDVELYDTNLDMYASNALVRNNITTFGQLRRMSRVDLSALKGMGPAKIDPIAQFLSEAGIHI
jgi:DNA-directed RNA polymerase alpha subunit